MQEQFEQLTEGLTKLVDALKVEGEDGKELAELIEKELKGTADDLQKGELSLEDAKEVVEAYWDAVTSRWEVIKSKVSRKTVDRYEKTLDLLKTILDIAL